MHSHAGGTFYEPLIHHLVYQQSPLETNNAIPHTIVVFMLHGPTFVTVDSL